VLALLVLLAASEGRPLFYWSGRPAVITAAPAAEPKGEARVLEVHAALDGGELALRLTLDRPVSEALYLPDGTPVSGRLRAVLYLDADGDRTTGLAAGPSDLRTGADARLELGVVSLAPDPEESDPAEKVAPAAVVTASLHALLPDGRRRALWRADDQAAPGRVSVHGEYVELRLPAEHSPSGRARLILAGDEVRDGRLR
jgi:hypothetical protein